MSPFLWLLVAVLAAPAVAYFVYRLAHELGFLDPPVDRQHELKRTIIVSLYAFLLFLPVGIYGTEKGWPRVWVLFGIVDGLALAFFAAGGIWASVQLWRLRHPEVVLPETLPVRPPEEGDGLAPAVPPDKEVSEEIL
jgi:hypothetical protein